MPGYSLLSLAKDQTEAEIYLFLMLMVMTLPNKTGVAHDAIGEKRLRAACTPSVVVRRACYLVGEGLAALVICP